MPSCISLFAALSLAAGASLCASVEPSFGKIPISFEVNRGQTAKHVDFLTRGAGYTVYLSPREATLALQGAVVRMKLAGASRSATGRGIDPLAARSNYFIGTDPKRWTRDVPHFSQVEYRGVYPGVDVLYYGKQRQLEYDFRVAPGADPERIRLQFEGLQSMRIDSAGDLILATPDGELVKHKPIVYQEINGSRVSIEGRYRLMAKNEVGFAIGAYRRDLPLIIDPILSYSTYLGGTGADTAAGIAVDASGSAYIVGTTPSADFPKTTGAIQGTLAGQTDVFVAKLTAAGSALVYSTFLGGPGIDFARAVQVDGAGQAYILLRPDFSYPTTPGAYSANACCSAVTKLSAAGNQLLYSTRLDGSAVALAIDSMGNAYMTGGGSVPTTLGVLQPTASERGVLITKLNSAGTSLVYSALLGGFESSAIRIDGGGNAYVTGWTNSSDFPATQTIGTSGASGPMAFVTKLNISGTAVVYSTLIASAYPSDLALSPTGEAFLTGIALTGFPTTGGSYQPTTPSGAGHFGAKLSSTGTALAYATFLTSGTTLGAKLAVDSTGNAYYALPAEYTSPPTTPDALQQVPAGAMDGYLVQLDATGSNLIYATYLGGSGRDSPAGIATDSSGNVYITGTTSSTNLPVTPGVLQTANAGSSDAFVMKIDTANVSCSYSLSPASQAFTAAASAGTIVITAGAGCVWIASSSASWIQLSDPSSGIGNGTLNFSVTSNDSTQPRSGSIAIGGQAFAISQPGAACIYSIAPQSLTFTSAGGISNVSVSTPQGCSWSATSNQPWITITSSANGYGPGLVQYTVGASGGASRSGTMTIAGQTFTVTQPGAPSAAPIGVLDTPANGATNLSGAIGVTGWALDDVEVVRVSAWRNPIGSEPRDANGLVFIADAVFLEGARPDVAAAYTAYPRNTRAGWGMQILTNMLPNSNGSAGTGNGAYKFSVFAHDAEGWTTPLGAPTVTVNNATAARPFGTLDTPGNGATISGVYTVFGWALTPPPGMIPTDGSTIWVFVDGVSLGHPSYGHLRTDIATLFPGYANSNGAVGYYYLDTTKLSNGLHSIAWSVTDNLGRVEGIGSRLFWVNN